MPCSPKGSFRTSTMGNACSVCANGKALDLSLGATSCTSCPIGYYVSRTANANQMTCLPW